MTTGEDRGRSRLILFAIRSRAEGLNRLLSTAGKGGPATRGHPMSDRNVITTTVFIAGIMLGAFTVQLKDQISLRIGTLGFNAIMQCAAMGP